MDFISCGSSYSDHDWGARVLYDGLLGPSEKRKCVRCDAVTWASGLTNVLSRPDGTGIRTSLRS